MGLGDFWLQFNNGKKEQLKDAKHGVRKEQVDSKFHNLFDIYDENGDGTLETNELEGIFKGIKKFAGADKILNSSENIQARSIFAQQANIEDADFQGFVQTISTASEEIVSSSEKPTPDGGKEITTEYKDGSVETISYYPDGSYKFKKFDHKYTQTTSYYTIADEPDKQISPKALEVRIRNAYNKKVQEIKNANRSSDIESRRAIYLSIPDYKQFREEYKMAHNICMHSSTNEYERHDLELSDRAKFDVEVRKFLIEHYIETHQGAKEALDTMGILDDIGAAINTEAGELWNSIVNVYNKWFGDGTQEDYQNFYELVNKFNPHYDKSLIAKSDLEFMTNHPDAFFGSFETDIVKNTGHKFELEKTLQFQHLTEQYQTATIYKQRIDLLKKALSEVDMYWAEQTALTNNPVQSDGLNPYTHIVSANNYLLAFFGNDQEAADMVLNGTIGNPDATKKKIKELMQDAQDALENALLKRTTTLESDETGSMTMSISSKGFEQYSYDELQAKYQSEYKEMYGVDFVPDELTEKVMGAKATGGMVKLAAITIISIIITRSPIMAEITGAAGGAAIEGASANLIRTLVTKYGQTAVQQGIKFAMTTGTLATDVGLTLLNQVTSERGVNGQELWESSKGSAKYIYFGAYIGAPIAQAVAQRIGQIGMTGRLLEGGTKATQGAIQTTTISGEKLLQNLMKGSNSLLAKGGAFATDVGLFTGLEIATEGANPLDAFSEQGEMLGKLKVMNGFIEYMLGAKTHTALDRARWDVALDKSGVKNWNIKEIQQPNGKGNKTIYTVDIDGIPIGRFEDLNVLATAMMERVSAVYSTTKPQERESTETNNTEINEGNNFTEATKYNDAVARLKTSNSAREITTSDGEKIIIYHRNALNLGDYTYAKFDKQGILIEQGTIAANKFEEKFGISIDNSTRLNKSSKLMMSLDMGIIESLIRTIKLNYDHSKFNVAKTPIEKLAVIFGIDVNDKEAMQKLQEEINSIKLEENATLEEEVEALQQIYNKAAIEQANTIKGQGAEFKNHEQLGITKTQIPVLDLALLANITNSNSKLPKVGSASKGIIKDSYKFFAKNHNGDFIKDDENHYYIVDKSNGKIIRECFFDKDNPQNNTERFYSYSEDGKNSICLTVNGDRKIIAAQHILYDGKTNSIIEIEYNSSEKIKVTSTEKTEELTPTEFSTRFGFSLDYYNLIEHSSNANNGINGTNTTIVRNSFNFGKYLNYDNVASLTHKDKTFEKQYLYDESTNSIIIKDFSTGKIIRTITDAKAYMEVLSELEQLLPKDRINLYIVEAMPLENLLFIRDSFMLGKRNPEARRLSTEWKNDKNTCQANNSLAHPNQNRRALHQLLKDNPVLTSDITVTRCDDFDWLNTQHYKENGIIMNIGEKIKNLIDSHATQEEIDSFVNLLRVTTPLTSPDYMACNLNTTTQSWIDSDYTKVIYNIHIRPNSKCLYIDDLVNPANMTNKDYVYQSELVIDKGQGYAIMGMKLSPDKSKMIIDLEILSQ